MTRCPAAAHLRLWLKRASLPSWAGPELIDRVTDEKPSAIDQCVNRNAEDSDEGFLNALAWCGRKEQVEDTLNEICQRRRASRQSLVDVMQGMLSGDATRQDGDLQKWLRRLRRPDPDDLPHLWTCYACFQVFERRPRRRCPECSASTSSLGRLT